MKLQEIYAKDINRNIQGVIKSTTIATSQSSKNLRNTSLLAKSRSTSTSSLMHTRLASESEVALKKWESGLAASSVRVNLTSLKS